MNATHLAHGERLVDRLLHPCVNRRTIEDVQALARLNLIRLFVPVDHPHSVLVSSAD